MYTVLKLIPDRTVSNKKGYEFARSLHDLFIPWYKRIQVKQKSIQPLEKVWYIINLSPKNISFYLATESETYIRQRLNRYWERSTIQQSELTPIPITHTLVSEMKYRRHNMFALSADWREDTVPIASILNVIRDMKDQDEARIIICCKPYNRTTWADWSDRAHEEFKQGKTPSRRGIASKLNLKTVAKGLDTALSEVSDIAETLFETDSEAKAKDRNRKKKPDLEKREIMLDGRLDKFTTQKRNEPTFKTHIYITSHSDDINRRQITLRGIANAFTELSGDNELRRIDHKKSTPRIIAKLNKWEIPLDFDSNIFSSTELGKLFQLPTASLQDEYTEYMETIEHRETDLPQRLLDDTGIKLGSVTFKGETHHIHFPTKDHDELCLPRIVIGGMGMGKTRGFGGNFAVEAVKHGFTAFTIDVAKGELGDEVEKWCKNNGKQDKFIRIKFGTKPIGLDWCEALGSRHAANRFASEVLNFFNLHGHEAGIETARYIRLAAKTVGLGTGKLSDILRLFIDSKYLVSEINRLKKIGKDDLVLQWQSFVDLSPGMRGKVLDPILNRIDFLSGDDYLNECLQNPIGIDFRKWINGGYTICLDVPKDELGAEATDILVSILIAKIWLATLSRKGINQNPAFLVMDEPHQFMSSAKHWKSMVVESRKWRLGLVWLFHSWEQIPRDLAEIIKSAAPHYHLYTSSKKTYSDLKEEILPFSIKEALKTPRYHAINVIRSSGVTVEPFMSLMTKPPSEQ